MFRALFWGIDFASIEAGKYPVAEIAAYEDGRTF
jgi:hypothetical protein